jgi:hypothetical protein
MANNTRIYYSQEAADRARREQTTMILTFLGLGVAAGLALSFLLSPMEKKKKRDLGNAIGDVLQTGQKTSEKALHRLEKEFNELKKNLEDRVR